MIKSIPFPKIFTRLLLASSLCLVASQGMLPIKGVHASTILGTTIQVTTTQDELNVDGNCSLREAVRAANLDTVVDGCPAGNGMDIIDIPAGTYLLTLAGTGEDQALTGDLDLTGDTIIVGVKTDSTIIDGNGIDRVFHVVQTVTVRFDNLTIRNGNIPAAGMFGGGGILNGSSDAIAGTIQVTNCRFENNHADKDGGGLDNEGDATLRNVTFYANSANGRGGGLANRGTLGLSYSTFYQNSAGEIGGGIYNHTAATLVNVTISGNSAPDTVSESHGGGMFNDGTLNIINSTLAANTTAILNNGQLQVKNSIFADSTIGANCDGPSGVFNSQGHNLDSGNKCQFIPLYGDLVNTSPMLGSLQDNEGPTLTQYPQTGSPVIDAADNLDCPYQDQRGAFRPADGNNDSVKTCDIGSVEFNGTFPLFVFLPYTARH